MFRGNSFFITDFFVVAVLLCGICFSVWKGKLMAERQKIIRETKIYMAFHCDANEREIKGLK